MTAEGTYRIQSEALEAPLLFQSQSALTAFVERERDTWAAWRKKMEAAKVPVGLMAYISWEPVVNQWLSIAKLAEQNPSQAAQQASTLFDQSTLIYSKSATGTMILALAETAPGLSGLLASLFASPRLREAFNNSNFAQTHKMWTTAIAGLPHLLSTVSARKHSADALAASKRAEELSDQTLRYSKAAGDLVTSASGNLTDIERRGIRALADATRRARKTASTDIEQIRAEWSALKRTFSIKFQTRAPYTYWRQKQINHRKVAQAWMRTFTWSIVLGAVAIAGGGAVLLTVGTREPWPWLLPAVCLGVPAFITLWIARLANRHFGANTIRAEDAAERAVMVRTLFAMSEKTDRVAGDAEFLTMISALFRPGPGLASDDSPAVGALDAVVKVLQGKPGDATKP